MGRTRGASRSELELEARPLVVGRRGFFARLDDALLTTFHQVPQSFGLGEQTIDLVLLSGDHGGEFVDGAVLIQDLAFEVLEAFFELLGLQAGGFVSWGRAHREFLSVGRKHTAGPTN